MGQKADYVRSFPVNSTIFRRYHLWKRRTGAAVVDREIVADPKGGRALLVYYSLPEPAQFMSP
jgi:hypothetical protein